MGPVWVKLLSDGLLGKSDEVLMAGRWTVDTCRLKDEGYRGGGVA